MHREITVYRDEMVWETYKSGNKKFDRRFIYYRSNLKGGGVRYERSTKLWWKPFERVGKFLERGVYFFHSLLGKKKENILDHQYQLAKELSKGNEEFEKLLLKRFFSINPWVVFPYNYVLKWIRNHLTFD